MMNKKLLKELRCPECEHKFKLKNQNELICCFCKKKYLIENSIPRFVPDEGYVKNFGIEWNDYPKIKIVYKDGIDIAEHRFYRHTNWTKTELKGKKILEVGCGNGRFSKIILNTGAELYAFDLSKSIESNRNSNLKYNLHLFQADLNNLPLKKDSFDYIYCVGVLQHTPSPEKSFKNLIRYLKKGGKITIDIYPKKLKNLLHFRYFLRPITTRIKPKKLYWFIKNIWVPILLPLSNIIVEIPFGFGRLLKNAIPVENIKKRVKTRNKEELRKWSTLTTFDWLSAKYDFPQSLKNIQRWFRECNLDGKVYLDNDIIIGRGKK